MQSVDAVENLEEFRQSIAKEVFQESNIKQPDIKEMSVYRAQTRKPDSLGHAMAVIAFVIGSDDFRPEDDHGIARPIKTKHKKKVRAREGVTLLLDCERAAAHIGFRKTPKGCTTIYAAATYHFDIDYADATTMAMAVDWVIDELRQHDALLKISPDSPHPFADQAKAVLTACRDELNSDGENWNATARFTVEEQVARLRRLAALIDFDLDN